MKRIKVIVIGLVAVFLMASAVYAEAQSPGQKRAGWQKERVFKELNLTPEQEKKLEENRKAQGEAMKALFTASKEKEKKLQENLKNPAVTRAAVEPLVKEIKDLQGQLIERRIAGIFAVKEILTPEQFTKFQQMTEKRHETLKGRFQNWQKRRRGTDQNKGCAKPI